MKIIEQSHEILTEPDQLKLIELAGRTCYKSEDKITEDSAKQFVKMLTKSGHHAMLEFGYACFVLPVANIDYIQTSEHSKYLTTSEHLSIGLVSGNLRAWLEFFQKEPTQYLPVGILAIEQFLYKKYPEIFPNLGKDWVRKAEHRYEIDMTPEQKKLHAVRTVRCITNRGVTHELVRHRPCSFAQESTRYVEYDGTMEFILPVWCEKDICQTFGNSSEAYYWLRKNLLLGRDLERVWISSCVQSEKNYSYLLSKGWKAQQAREVLSNSLKTEIVIQATIQEWKHIFKLRCAKAAHPQMRALMLPLQAEFYAKEPELFDEPKGTL